MSLLYGFLQNCQNSIFPMSECSFIITCEVVVQLVYQAKNLFQMSETKKTVKYSKTHNVVEFSNWSHFFIHVMGCLWWMTPKFVVIAYSIVVSALYASKLTINLTRNINCEIRCYTLNWWEQVFFVSMNSKRRLWQQL